MDIRNILERIKSENAVPYGVITDKNCAKLKSILGDAMEDATAELNDTIGIYLSENRRLKIALKRLIRKAQGVWPCCNTDEEEKAACDLKVAISLAEKAIKVVNMNPEEEIRKLENELRQGRSAAAEELGDANEKRDDNDIITHKRVLFATAKGKHLALLTLMGRLKLNEQPEE